MKSIGVDGWVRVHVRKIECALGQFPTTKVNYGSSNSIIWTVQKIMRTQKGCTYFSIKKIPHIFPLSFFKNNQKFQIKNGAVV